MFSKLWQYQIIWYLFAGFKTTTLCSVRSFYDSWNMFFLLKYDSWKLQLESWNTNHESLNQSLDGQGDICFIWPSCYDASVKKDKHIKNYWDQPGRLLISFDFSYIELLDNWRTLWSAMDWVIEENLCNTEINHKHTNKKKCSTDAERSRCHQNQHIEIHTSVDTEIIHDRKYKQYKQKFYSLRLQQKKLFSLKPTK